ncbi:MAG TPA: anti-sigma factor [Streptosporangiaceae bacterium]
MRSRQPEPHTLAGAYAADALDGPDRARFERHLARCQECTREVSGLRETTVRLAAAAAAPPPATFKERVLAEAGRTRQLPPVTRGSHAPRTGRAGIAGPGPARVRGRVRAGWPRLRLALGLAGIIMLAAAAIWVGGVRLSPPAQQPAGSMIAAVLTAPDATIISAPARTGGTATVVMSGREHMLVFAAAGLPSLPASRCYELWLMGQGRDRDAGLLPMPRHDMIGPVLASGLRPGDRLGLTVEPSGGSARPTSGMILEVVL